MFKETEPTLLLGWRFGTEEEPLITAVENSWEAMELLFCLNT